jgi:hypothetical protein
VYRLLAALQIDNREAAHGETNRTVDIESIVVGTAMPNRIAHASQQRFVNRFPVVSNESNDATHRSTGR